MADRFVLLREPGRMRFHLPDEDDDSSTLCGEPTDEMEGVEVRADHSLIVCGPCMKAATKL